MPARQTVYGAEAQARQGLRPVAPSESNARRPARPEALSMRARRGQRIRPPRGSPAMAVSGQDGGRVGSSAERRAEAPENPAVTVDSSAGSGSGTPRRAAQAVPGVPASWSPSQLLVLEALPKPVLLAARRCDAGLPDDRSMDGGGGDARHCGMASAQGGPVLADAPVRAVDAEKDKRRLRVRPQVRRLVADRRQAEMCRCRDFRIHEPLWPRIFGLGNIEMHTADASHPLVVPSGIRDSEEATQLLRAAMYADQRERGYREIGAPR